MTLGGTKDVKAAKLLEPILIELHSTGTAGQYRLHVKVRSRQQMFGKGSRGGEFTFMESRIIGITGEPVDSDQCRPRHLPTGKHRSRQHHEVMRHCAGVIGVLFLSVDQIVGLYAIGPFIDRRNAGIAEKLRSTAFLEDI